MALGWIIAKENSELEATQNLQFIGALLCPGLELVQIIDGRRYRWQSNVS